MYINYEGAEIVLRKSKNPTAMANAEELLIMLKKLSNELLATMHVSTSASSSGTDKVKNAAAAGGASSSTASAAAAGGEDIASSMENNHQLATKLTTTMGHCKQSFDGCTESMVRYNGEAARGPTIQTLQGLTTEVVKYTQSVDGCTESIIKNGEALNGLGQSYVKFKADYGPDMQEVHGFVSFLIDKAPAFKESMAMMTEAKERDMKVEEQMINVKKQSIDLSNLQSTSAKENADRDIEVARRKTASAKENAESVLEMERRKIDSDIEMGRRKLALRNDILAMDERELEFVRESKRAKYEHVPEPAPEPVPEPAPEPAPGPADEEAGAGEENEEEEEDEEEVFITVREIANKHAKKIFAGIPQADRANIIMEAGGYAKKMYESKLGYRTIPKKVLNGGHKICQYPREAEPLILDALNVMIKDYMKKKSVLAAGQRPITEMFATKPSNA